ncbi:hypothetical protein JOC48_002356 [Aquibacillus albus]|uniref:Uncharacterized protein n=1 Tax=Aquibacillus albus TaxID=1168171 RepID=A0ABS2N154_9BACI|nr:hypothetical protein [Aquibacillus albus]
MKENSITEYKISAVEAGEWKTAQNYIDLIYSDSALMYALTNFDVHSYWSEQEDKVNLTEYMEICLTKPNIVASV